LGNADILEVTAIKNRFKEVLPVEARFIEI